MSDGRELESRVERLETALREIDARLARLEQRPASGGRAILPVPPSSSPAVEESSLGLFGISILILGGAFVLRALTESSLLPRLGGALFGLVYAAVWMWNSDRLARRHRPQAASFHGVTAAVIAFPLVWETTVRFAVIPATVAGILIGAFALAFLWIAVRSQQQMLVWIGSVAATVAAFAVGPSPAMLVIIAAIGTATSIAARRWEFAPWPAALASNIIALIVIFTRPAGTVAALAVFTLLWAAAAAIPEPRDVSAVVQATVAILIGIGGSTLLLLPNAATASLVWSLIGLATAELARRSRSRALSIQSVAWIVAASVAGGLLLATAGAFTGDAGSVELPPEALACGSVAIFGFLRLPGGAEKIVMLSIFLCMAFTGVLTVILPSFSSGALLRTAVLASFASLLAVVGRLMDVRVASILARAVLVVGGLKLLAEDLRVGSAAILVISFACYGLALLIVAKSGWAAGRRESGVTAITT